MLFARTEPNSLLLHFTLPSPKVAAPKTGLQLVCFQIVIASTLPLRARRGTWHGRPFSTGTCMQVGSRLPLGKWHSYEDCRTVGSAVREMAHECWTKRGKGRFRNSLRPMRGILPNWGNTLGGFAGCLKGDRNGSTTAPRSGEHPRRKFSRYRKRRHKLHDLP